jgi:DNA-binding FadR family transcriptional regulator
VAAAARTLAERVAAQIRAEIVARRLRPGDRLPGEIEHARRLGVSRGIVREGRRQLVSAGLIVVANGRRAVVSKLRGAPLDGFLANAVATRQLAVDEVLELRRAIEIAVAGLARGAAPADVAVLRGSPGRCAPRSDGPPTSGTISTSTSLRGAPQNPLFVMLIESMRDRSPRRCGRATRAAAACATSRTRAAHEAILAAVNAGDGALAERAMRAHFADVAAALES